jgi:aminopeptidase-like protein
VRATLHCLREHIPLKIHEVPSGSLAFDWTVPKEWNIRDAYIKDTAGERVLDFRACNLHVMSYSVPVHQYLPLQELKSYIFTLPEQPNLIPYRTSYYKESWGFCMEHNRLQTLSDGVYEVLIDSSLENGNLTYGEYLHQGETEQEILLSAHICHPSLANDNCSGLAVLTSLAEQLVGLKTRYTYRFIFAPGTIGAIVWLSRNEHMLSRIAHGLIVSCVGDSEGPVYKKSRRSSTTIDRVMTHVLHHAAPAGRVVEFSPVGYDERQYCSPGFNLPVGLLQRSQFGKFPEYHTSGDNLDFIRPDSLASSYRIIVTALDILENDVCMENMNQKCEPQLGKRGLYSTVGGSSHGPEQALALLWVLNLSDGSHSLFDIAERAGIPFDIIYEASVRLEGQALVRRSSALTL